MTEGIRAHLPTEPSALSPKLPTYFHLLSLYSNYNSSICGGIFHL